jgi:hypothetical protein
MARASDPMPANSFGSDPMPAHLLESTNPTVRRQNSARLRNIAENNAKGEATRRERERAQADFAALPLSVQARRSGVPQFICEGIEKLETDADTWSLVIEELEAQNEQLRKDNPQNGKGKK